MILSEHDQPMVRLWKTYQNSYPFAKDVLWMDALIRRFQ